MDTVLFIVCSVLMFLAAGAVVELMRRDKKRKQPPHE